mgnify:CR=1 FL=1
MPDSFFLKGLMVALVFGVPAGTIGALTIQHTLQRGFKAGVITGLGSTVADIFYACVGICGISFVSDFVAKYQQFIRVLGGMFIILIGVSIFRKDEISNGATENVHTLSRYFVISFGIAIMNPATVLSFMVAFALVKIPATATIIQECETVCGIICGSLLWWIVLSGVVCLFRRKLNDYVYAKVNIILGILIISMGILFVLKR